MSKYSPNHKLSQQIDPDQRKLEVLLLPLRNRRRMPSNCNELPAPNLTDHTWNSLMQGQQIRSENNTQQDHLTHPFYWSRIKCFWLRIGKWQCSSIKKIAVCNSSRKSMIKKFRTKSISSRK